MAAFRDNKQALYGILQYFPTTSNPRQNSIRINPSQKKYTTELLHNRLKAMQHKKVCLVSRVAEPLVRMGLAQLIPFWMGLSLYFYIYNFLKLVLRTQ